MEDCPATILVKIDLKCEILGINQFYLSSSFQIFQKFQGSTNISVRELMFQDGLNILWFATRLSSDIISAKVHFFLWGHENKAILLNQ